MKETVFDLQDFASMQAFEVLNIADLPTGELEVKVSQLRAEAVRLGLTKTEFNKILASYLKKHEPRATQNSFIGIPGDYSIDPYFIDAHGRICKAIGETVICACSHPLYVAQRLVNITTGEQKIEIGYSRDGGKTWKHEIVNRSVISSARNITQLSDFGISATSENARHLVAYLQHFEDINYEQLATVQSIGRFGWINEYSFSPYAEEDGIIFDSQNSFMEIRAALNSAGSYDKWLELARKIRNGSSLVPKIVLAASFASVLIGPTKAMPFFVHLWGSTGTGKSVALMLAASVWANPEIGKYIKSFNSTAVAQETLAGTLYSLPLILDELQSIKDRQSFDKLIYELSEGSGRARGTVTGGLRETLTWKNCMITSGEQPITQDLSGGGAKNRIIEIECKEKLLPDLIGASKVIRENYGYAGREFVESLSPKMVRTAKKIQESTFLNLVESGRTEKQSLAASVIIAAESLVSEIIFKDKESFDTEDIVQLLITEEEASSGLRAYEWLRGWIVQNGSKFNEDSQEVFGKNISGGTAIIASVLRTACEKEGISLQSLAADLEKLGVLDLDPRGKRSKPVKIGRKSVRCYIVNDEFSDD